MSPWLGTLLNEELLEIEERLESLRAVEAEEAEEGEDDAVEDSEVLLVARCSEG